MGMDKDKDKDIVASIEALAKMVDDDRRRMNSLLADLDHLLGKNPLTFRAIYPQERQQRAPRQEPKNPPCKTIRDIPASTRGAFFAQTKRRR